jgi:restriction endonuclease
VVVHDETQHPAQGRTTTALDDRLIRAISPLHPAVVVLLGLIVYAAWGIALPLLLSVKTAWLLSFNTEGALFAGLIFFARLLPVIEGRLRRLQLEQATDLRRLSAREFEELVGELFRLEGWNVTETGGHGWADGNVDLRLRRGAEQRIVQCKQWTSRGIGVDEVRKLGGTLLREGLSGSEGILITSAEFYPAAIKEADKLGITLIDGSDLVGRLDKVGASGLLNRAARDPWPCPDCATPMILGESPHGWWLRCPKYGTDCRGKHDLGKDPRLAIERLLADS